MKQTGRIAFAIAAMAASAVWAVEVTPEQAKTAVRNWIDLSPKRMDAEFRSKNAEAPVTARCGADRALYHAVNLEGGGFVVTSGDTRLSPIVAFSGSGRFDGGEESPLHALLARRFEGAVSALAKQDRATGAAGGDVSCAEAESEWAELLADGGTPSRATGLKAREYVISERVDRLLETQWGQKGYWKWHSDGSRDYYPACDWYVRKDSDLKAKSFKDGDIPCGCTATAGAQLMYFWKAPSGFFTTFSNTCYINGDSVTKTSRSGTFDFNSMFKTWDDQPFPTATQREAVGKLVWNVCVAVGMSWTTPSAAGYAGAGTASCSTLVEQMKSRFGYKSGEFVYYNIDTDSPPADIDARKADFNNALFASLDAKMPVVMTIFGYKTSKDDVKQDGRLGHAIVADGYGYVSTKRFTHLNFGWDGSSDAWYYLPDDAIVLEKSDGSHDNYVEFRGIGFNIHPTVSGDVISGRVLYSSTKPVSGATVTLYSGSTVKAMSNTDANGIYSFRVTSPGNYKVKAVSGGLESQTKTVSISALSTDGTYGSGGKTGNKWGNDLTVTTTYTVTYDHGKYGTGAQQTATKTHSVALTLKGAIFTTTGGTQTGWATENLGPKKYELGEKYVADANVTLYPSWTPNTYKIRFNGNGGTGSMADMPMTYGTSKNLAKNTFRNGTRTFAGWALSASGSVVYYDGEYVKNVTGTQGAVVTLYARWSTSSTKYSVFYNRGKYGSGSQTTVPKYYGVPLKLRGSMFTTSGAYQTGWATENLGAKVYELGANYTANASVTLYPAWSPNPWYVRFNPNGGTGKMADEQMTYGTTKALAQCTFRKDGYAFAGWAAEANGSVVYADCAKVKNLTTALNGVVTLYAKWKAASQFTVTYMPGKYGSGTKRTATKQKGVALTLPDALFTTTGAMQDGWAEENLGAKKYDLKGQYTENSSITLYPSWKPNTYYVKFEWNGGSGNVVVQSMVYGKTAKLRKCTFTRPNYRFVQWSAGDGAVYADEAIVKNLTAVNGSMVILKAQWARTDAAFAGSFATSGKSVAATPEWAVGTFYGGDEDASTTITVSSAGKVSGKVLLSGGRWTIVGKAAGLRIDAVVADADGNSAEVVFAIIKKEDGRCRIESEDGSIWAE